MLIKVAQIVTAAHRDVILHPETTMNVMNPDRTTKTGHPGLLYWVFRSSYIEKNLYVHYLCKLQNYDHQIYTVNASTNTFTPGLTYTVLLGVTGVKM